MIKHIVMWNLAGRSDNERSENAQKVKEAFEGLRGKIPGLQFLEVGIDFSAVDYACHCVLYSEFKDPESLKSYASHPEHLRVRDELEGIRISRHQVDFESAGVF